jgi:hypothetical protein
MAFDRTAMIEKAAPVLHGHGYTSNDVAGLFAVAARENHELRRQLEEKKLPSDSPAWKQAWTKAGANRLAFDRGISVAEMRKGLAKAKLDGLMLTIDRGPNIPALRCINTETFDILFRAGSPKDLYARFLADKKLDLGPLDWLLYLTRADVVSGDDLDFDQLLEVRDRPEKIYYPSTFDRDRDYLRFHDFYVQQGCLMERGIGKVKQELRLAAEARGEKREPKKKDIEAPLAYLLIRDPDGSGPIHIRGHESTAVEAPARAEESFEYEEEFAYGD